MADKTVTVKPSGGDYTTLQGAITGEVAANANLTAAGMNGILNIEIGGTWSSADTTACTVNGFTTDATHYVNIYTSSSARHKGVWSSSYYQLLVSNATALTIYDEYVRLDGLQVGKSSSSANGQGVVYYAGVAAGNALHISNCIFKQAGNNSYREPGIYSDDADAVVYMWNTIVYGSGTADNALNTTVYAYRGTWSIYSCTVIGGKYGVYYSGATTCTVKNTYAGGTLTEDFYRGAGTLAKTNCASEDQSADDTSGADETQSNCVAAAVALDTDTFVNVTAGSQNFHLAADGLSPLMGAGVSTTGDSAPLNFTTDIDGDTRDSSWDIGADAWVVAVSSAFNELYMMFEA